MTDRKAAEIELPDWFWRQADLSMDPLIGPDDQYRAGARDMLAVLNRELCVTPQS